MKVNTGCRAQGRRLAVVMAGVISILGLVAIPADAAVQDPWGAGLNGNYVIGTYHYDGTTVWSPSVSWYTGDGYGWAVHGNIARINTWSGTYSTRWNCARALGGRKGGFNPIPDGVWTDGYCYAI